MKRWFAALLAGALFGAGLALSRMTDPNVVIGFLDVTGDFDPRLAFVLAGAVATTGLAFRLVLRRRRPLLADRFRLPLSHAIDRRLVAGALLFGIGWGLAGYCPGPALVGAAAGVDSALIFAAAMLAGSALQAMTARRRPA
ncbi:YeeE/YedE family protein [Pseudomonas sp. R2.Fl]|nr:YeeE/YedE family protein [Pseudomonas sp. R2.Fl]